MKIRTKYQGGNDPFEGDRILWLRSLPIGANITGATVTLIPANAPQFEETFTFPSNDGGITKTVTPVNSSNSAIKPAVEIDFHARRTVTSVEGSGGVTTLQIDMGGAYTGIADDGTFLTPDKTDFKVNLSSTTAPLPSLTLNKFKLTGDRTNLDITKVTIRSVPTNVSVRLGQLPPVWTKLGELATADTSPNFATVFNAFLATAQQQDGFYQIPLLVHSDTIARLDVELVVEYFIEQRVLPPHLPEVKLAYGFSTLPSLEDTFTTVTLPKEAQAIAGRSSAKIIGEFNPTRIALGPIGDDPTSVPSKTTEINILVSPTQQLAQPLKSDTEIAVTGIDVPLGKIEPGLAGLNISIQSDADGKPSGEVLVSAEVRVDKPLPDQSTWGSATLPTPFRAEATKRYWLILQSQVGEAHWLGTHDTTKDTTGHPGLQSSRDGGLSWRIATVEKAPSPLRALFRLRTVPENFTVPVQLQIGKGADAVRLRLDDFAPLGRIEFSFDFAKPLGEYLSKVDKSSNPCGTGELLVNGDFNQPPHDDATRRLFGFDTASGDSITGTVNLSRGVNLSRERFITLAVNNDKPISIDCAGVNPARTTLEEIVNAINKATKRQIASSEDVLFLSAPSEGRVELLPWRRAGIPQGWEQSTNTQEQLWRIKVPTAADTQERVVAALYAKGTNPVVLAQRIPATSECTYKLQFFFEIEDYPADIGLPEFGRREQFAPARWEVHWLDATGQIIQEEQEAIASYVEFSGQFAVSSRRPKRGIVELLLTAPQNTKQVEIRFVQPPPGLLIVDNVSLQPTSQRLRNSLFQQWQQESRNSPVRLPAGWQNLSGWVDEQSTPKRGAKLRGDGPDDAVIVQTAAVVAGERYELQVNSQFLSASNSDETRSLQQRSRLELHWQNNGSVGTPVIIPLDGRDFPTHTWVGIAPDGATSAEIRIVHPKNQGDLLIESVSLSQAGLVSVPLIFLAEAPGELTVSDWRVAYDLPTPPAPANPPRSTRTPIVPLREAKALLSPQPVVEPLEEPEIPRVSAPIPQPVTPPPSSPPAPPTPSNTAVEPIPTQIQEEPDTSDTSVEETPNLPPASDPFNDDPAPPTRSNTAVEPTPTQIPEQPETSDTSVEETPNLPPPASDPFNDEPLAFLPRSPVVEPPQEPDSPEIADAQTQNDSPQPDEAQPRVKKILLQTIPKIIVILPATQMAKGSLTYSLS